ncbi:Rubredoxin [Actinopolymorpha cephalotaxi]|uniref:Rubredoxin n=1 Tax=Actinopolymorpha cephalotaxi TaxID=504797 RepID=A0A1I3C4Z1_9ACTN|nr:rubredoxin [Actinopolymorpha cephalotaxi]NYH85403.1 rubredoxin [Actinopolymorpha cephalotaxi]SFH69396.1 Rubredoxin [Actinopolymorpha cephalotaxi]
MTNLTGFVTRDGTEVLIGNALVRGYRTLLRTTRALKVYAAADTTSKVLATAPAGDYPVLEIRPGAAKGSDYVRVSSTGLPGGQGWICSRWRTSHYALPYDDPLPGGGVRSGSDGRFTLPVPDGAPAEQVYRLRAGADGHLDGQSVRGYAALPFTVPLPAATNPVAETRLVSLLHHFRGWYYTPKRPGSSARFTPQYPYDIGITVSLETDHPKPPTYDDCCSFVEALLVRGWKDATVPGFSWNLTKHNRSMITDPAHIYSSVEVLEDAGVADHIGGDDPPPPWTVVQGWRDPNNLGKGGHTFLIVDIHAETGRVLTLESNLTYGLNGPGMRMLGGIEEFMGREYLCPTDGYVYDPAVGDPAHGVPPGTSFRAATMWDLVRGNALPPDWVCPGCGTNQMLFVPYCRPPRDWWKHDYLKTWDDIRSYYAGRRLARLRVRDLAWVR